MKAVLQSTALRKNFDGIEVLKGIDFSMDDDEFVAVMGQSGSGKSTLLYNLSGMDRPSSGAILFDGEDISLYDDERMSALRLDKMGFVFQQSFLLRTLSVRDNIILPGFKAHKSPREQVNAYASALMDRMGISSIADHDIKKVSGGQLQRAAICRALINRPLLLFGDEPTGALNSSMTQEILDILNEVNEAGTAILLVTHDAKVAARAGRVVFLADGRVVDELLLGKYRGEFRTDREERTFKWLEKQGF
ncbi:MAG: ABC transporter ATP-binding protein [Sphaerochaetaceae bacterium]|nr:ABC transporter ATP-binding protein [Sphaerochaetaceae bacterium]